MAPLGGHPRRLGLIANAHCQVLFFILAPTGVPSPPIGLFMIIFYGLLYLITRAGVNNNNKNHPVAAGLLLFVGFLLSRGSLCEEVSISLEIFLSISSLLFSLD